jgi:hypothetical protein
MKSLTLQLQDSVNECLLDLIDKNPSTELEAEHKAKYGWSDDTYQKILALRQSISDIGAAISDAARPAANGKTVTRMVCYNTKTTKEANELLLLKMCNWVGIRLSHCELVHRGAKYNNDFPYEVTAFFLDGITPAQQRDLTLLIKGHTI